MDGGVVAVLALLSIITAFLMADRFKRQGHKFWQVFIMGTLALFGICMMLYGTLMS